jgi:hypothetical protein
MANLPVVCVVTAAAMANANLVWAAMGRGPSNFTRKLCAADPAATYLTAATHYLMSDASAGDSDVYEWQAMASGNLPDIGSNIWGADGIITSADAQDAISAANLQVYSASGNVTPADHVTGILASRGLQYVPDMPL